MPRTRYPMRLMPGRPALLAMTVAAASFGMAGAVLSASGDVTISQKDQQFQPGSVTIAKDQSLVISNDDGATVHHAYVESAGFNFDSGDQKPGSHTRIVFPAKGDYQVLCGIHPKMRLDVHVK